MSRPVSAGSTTVDVAVHVYPAAALRCGAYPAEDRVTVQVSGRGGGVTLFLERAGIGRLRDALDEIEQDLTAGQDAMAAALTASLGHDSAA